MGKVMNNMILVWFGVLILCAAPSHADESIPASVKAKMNGYLGTWEFSEEVKDLPSADPVTVNGEWTARWIFESLIEWRGVFNSSGRSFTTVEFEGYDKQNKGYTNWYTTPR